MKSRAQRSAPVGFAEVPDFHVEVARRASPELRTRSLLVGGDPAKRGKVVAASADLRARGIVEGMGLDEALDRAPDAHWVRTDMRRAREVSGLLRAAIRQEVDAVEIDGLAGFYFRAPSQRDAAIELAGRLEARVAERTGLPLRFGVAPARFAARMAAEDAGLRGATVIGLDEFEDYLLRQPLERLPGVGPKTAARLAELGTTDLPSLRVLGLARLEVLLGNHGRSLWLLACGEDPKPLRVKRHPATLSREETLATRDDSGPEFEKLGLMESLTRLAGKLEQALRRDGLRARRIALRLTYMDERTVTRSRSLDSPISGAAELISAAQDLLARLGSDSPAVRRVGLVLKGLEISGAEDRQLDLF
jgi:DNA polymerase-4